MTAIVALYRSGSASVPGWRSSFQPGPLSEKHAFLGDRCETCHTPTRGVEATACITCHATAAADLAKQSTAFHANIQDCRGCHVEHEGAARPTRMDHAALLRIGSHLAVGASGHPGVSRQMFDDLAGFLGIPVSRSAEKDALSCASCHSNQDPHKQLFGRECAGCHETATWTIASFLHPSPTSKDCAQCHQAPPSHYMEHFRMVSMTVAGQMHAQVNQCYLCHKTNSWNDIKGVGWYKHH
ncbi:MAG: cytochrome c family protein [Methylobacterium sp.]|nr:cytochrome c family protein [Methylobacterium sp.]